jgi:hypothetical protein
MGMCGECDGVAQDPCTPNTSFLLHTAGCDMKFHRGQLYSIGVPSDIYLFWLGEPIIPSLH